MSVLTRPVILAEIAKGRLVIDPFAEDQVGPASIDLHLGDELRVRRLHTNGPVPVLDDGEPDIDTEVVVFDRPFLLEAGHTVHGITRERVRFPPDICGWIEGRSRIARLGLTVHVTSGFIHPGVDNAQVLEMSNVSGVPLLIHPGIRVCQIVLQRCEGEAVYEGRYAGQVSP